jgi:hypothetical protein
MVDDARSLPFDEPPRSAASRSSELTLLQSLDRAVSARDEGTRRALHAFVEVLVEEGQPPEAVVIALKHTLTQAHSLRRFDLHAREALRAALVSECIDHYFRTRRSDDAASPAPRPVVRPRERTRDVDLGSAT